MKTKIHRNPERFISALKKVNQMSAEERYDRRLYNVGRRKFGGDYKEPKGMTHKNYIDGLAAEKKRIRRQSNKFQVKLISIYSELLVSEAIYKKLYKEIKGQK